MTTELTVPDWLARLAHDPADYEDGRRVIEGTLTVGGYIRLNLGDGCALLDGEWTADQLREIADLIEAHAS